MAHVGEWGTAEDVRTAVEALELDEVQHGIAAADSPEVMRWLAERGVRLNVCPTSNLLLGRVARLEDHPIRRLFDAGVKVSVGTDDALVFGRSVSEEFLALHACGLFSGDRAGRDPDEWAGRLARVEAHPDRRSAKLFPPRSRGRVRRP